MADAAQSAMLAATGFDADPLLQTLEMTDGLDMPDQSRARLHKAIGAVLSEKQPGLRPEPPYPCAATRSPLWREKKTNSSWSADCAMTAADRTCPRARAAAGWRKGTATSKPRPPPSISGESSMKFVAPEQSTGTGGNHQKYAVLA